jgi:hypothetical protein
MCRVGVAFVAFLLGTGPAVATDDALYQRQDPDRRLIFSGVDLWRNGAFLYGGYVASPTGLDRSGFLWKILSGMGAYRYRSGDATFTAGQSVIAAMPGWRHRAARFEVSVYGGPEAQVHVMVPDDPGHPLRGLRFGFRGGVDLWHEPTRASMLASSISFSTIGPSVWSRVALGWKASDLFYVGPELIGSADTDYRQVRVGVHATAMRYGPYEWSIGVGWARDTDDRDGLYGRFDFVTRRLH